MPEQEGPTPKEIAEARRANLLQRHADGGRLTDHEREEIADLITEKQPEKKKKSKGRPSEELRWTIYKASKEFGIARLSLEQRMIQASIVQGDDGHYSTPQIIRAVFGDIDAAKLRKAEADAENAEIETAQLKGELMLTADAKAIWQDAIVTQRTIVENAKFLDDAAKEALLKAFMEIELTA